MIDGIRSLVRPVVTFGLVGTQCGLVVLWATGTENAEKAFGGLLTLTVIVIRDWFQERKELHERNANPTQ